MGKFTMEFIQELRTPPPATATPDMIHSTMAASPHADSSAQKAPQLASPPCASRVGMTVHSAERNAMLCRYPSKLCDNLRSKKRGGGLHRFCAYHRDRANINQRRVDHRRRLRRRGEPVPPIERGYHPAAQQTESTQVKQEPSEWHLDGFKDEDETQQLLPALSDDDLHQLMRLLDETESTNRLEVEDESTVHIKCEEKTDAL